MFIFILIVVAIFATIYYGLRAITRTQSHQRTPRTPVPDVPLNCDNDSGIRSLYQPPTADTPTAGGTVLTYEHYSYILEQNTHLLIAGTTGSGKTVLIEQLIKTRQRLSTGDTFIINPKRVGYNFGNVYVAKTQDQALQMLTFLHDLMMSRYREMETTGATTYKESARIYLVIDELAELVDGGNPAYNRQVNKLLKNLGRLARASQIFIIAATQDPSRKTITSQIQQNFVSAIGLNCRSAMESRQIIKENGCELLPPFGQGIYYTPALRQTTLINIPIYTD